MLLVLYLEIQFDFNLALNAPMDTNFKSALEDSIFLATENLILNFLKFVLTMGRE